MAQGVTRDDARSLRFGFCGFRVFGRQIVLLSFHNVGSDGAGHFHVLDLKTRILDVGCSRINGVFQ